MALDRQSRIYLIIFAVLLVLLVVTVGAAFLQLGVWALPVALAIASVKAVLILLYFMHLVDSDNVIRLAALSGIVWLGHMLIFTLADYITRYGVEPYCGAL